MTYYPIITLSSISKGYGYVANGYISAVTPIVEKYDYVNNTWAYAASNNTARERPCGFSLNGYGYTAGGYIAAVSAVVEKYDDVLNTWTTKTALTTARQESNGFILNGYGYSVAGTSTLGLSQVVERYNNNSNTWTTKTSTNFAVKRHAGFSLAGFGYWTCGNDNVISNKTEKYDDVLNTWTTKANVNTGRQYTTGFSLGQLKQSVQNPDIQEIIKNSIKEIVPIDKTTERAIDGTVYTNNESESLFVTVSASCISTLLNDNAYMQAFSDINADPVTAASGIVGIESGIAGEKVSTQLSFIVRPTHKYKVTQTLTAGSSITIGKWFETIQK